MIRTNTIAFFIVALVVMLAMAFPGSRPLFCQSGAEKIVVSVANNANYTDCSLYTMNRDGTGQAKLFDFHSHPKHNTGNIYQVKISNDGKYIYFSSDHAYVYTPAGRNLFRINSRGGSLEQLTPGPNSGKWNSPCPCGSVKGKLKRANGVGYSNGAVFLEGVGMVYSNSDGSFAFTKVPEGKRYIVGYRPGAQAFAAQEIFVARGTTWTVDLIPNSTYRWNFQHPAIYGNRVYHLSGMQEIQYKQVNGQGYAKIYKSTGSCGMSDIDGFDVGPVTGRLAIMDYQSGCPTNRGLYIADKNGGNLRLLVDMKANNNWSGGGEVFWSPDETKIAVEASFNYNTCYFIFNASNGVSLGYLCFPDKKYTLINSTLHGWSPDGNYILYSAYLNSPAQTVLATAYVSPQGIPDPKTIKYLVGNAAIMSADWGVLR